MIDPYIGTYRPPKQHWGISTVRVSVSLAGRHVNGDYVFEDVTRCHMGGFKRGVHPMDGYVKGRTELARVLAGSSIWEVTKIICHGAL